nr:MAG TPA: hypothetical protein [Caudoviricetes sp.]
MDNSTEFNPIKATRIAAGYTQRMYMFFWPTKRLWIIYKKGLTLRQALIYAAISRRWMLALMIVCIFGII